MGAEEKRKFVRPPLHYGRGGQAGALRRQRKRRRAQDKRGGGEAAVTTEVVKYAARDVIVIDGFGFGFGCGDEDAAGGAGVVVTHAEGPQRVGGCCFLCQGWRAEVGALFPLEQLWKCKPLWASGFTHHPRSTLGLMPKPKQRLAYVRAECMLPDGASAVQGGPRRPARNSGRQPGK